MFSYHKVDNGKALKLWDSHCPFDEPSMEQLRNIARLPFIYKHVAGMPDVHLGKGATIGSVIATKGAVVPAATGVDLGCGMMAVQTTLTASDLPDNLSTLRANLERAIPTGFNSVNGRSSKGNFIILPNSNTSRWNGLAKQYEAIIEKHPKIAHKSPHLQMGTLGGGNHFIEICLDEDNAVWIMLHSGSRGAGNRIGTFFIEAAKREMEKYYISQYIPDKDLAYLVEHSEIYDDYMTAVSWAQDFAYENRKAMMESVLRECHKLLPSFTLKNKAVNCHHNYIDLENHFGENVLVTRKGAVRARKGDYGIIPGSMGTGSFIVEGKGNPESFHSCSHGAGRVMSRTEAKKRISLEDHANAMKGIEARLDEGVLDESPAAYKDIGAVMAAQDDLVEIKFKLRQILNIKG